MELISMEPKSIDCFGDIISYSCSIFSNSENVHLIWRVSIPGLLPMSIIYNMTSDLNTIEYFPQSISALLTDYRRDILIESNINFKVLMNSNLNGTLLECAIANLSTKSVRLQVSSLGKT